MISSPKSNKLKSPGFTLVEVTVALMILAMSLTWSAQLVVNVLNLSVLTRDTTEATALAQKGLTEAMAQIRSCNSSNITLTAGGTDPDDSKIVTVTVLQHTSANTSSFPSELRSDKYAKVVSTVGWNFRGQPRTTALIQYVKRGG